MENGRYAQVEVAVDKVASTMSDIVGKQKGFIRTVVPNVHTVQGKTETSYVIIYWINP